MGYRASAVARFRVGLYASPDYLAANPGTITHPNDLTGHDLLLLREMSGAGQFSLTDRRGRRHDVEGGAVIRTGDFASIMRLVAAGGGIGPIPVPVAASAVESGVLVPILPDWTVLEANLYAISLSGDDAPARVRAFRDFVRAELS